MRVLVSVVYKYKTYLFTVYDLVLTDQCRMYCSDPAFKRFGKYLLSN